MGCLLYVLAVILIITWIIAFLVYHVTGGLIHLLLVIAIIAMILGAIRRP
ncbi:MAG TPA: lmo0937 family membrane protein [Ginsengibacter sp.]